MRIDLGQLTPPRITAHISDSLRRNFLMGNEIVMLHKCPDQLTR
jgi:hypothetical protein